MGRLIGHGPDEAVPGGRRDARLIHHEGEGTARHFLAAVVDVQFVLAGLGRGEADLVAVVALLHLHRHGLTRGAEHFDQQLRLARFLARN